MTWAIVVPIILASILKIVLTCMPTGTVNWLIRKFETHSRLDVKEVIVTVEDGRLEGEEKLQIINQLNEGIFIKKHYIHPGSEQLFLRPEISGTPIVIEFLERGDKLFVFSYHDRIDVVKQRGQKVIAYSMFSDSLQNSSLAIRAS
ncbi:MULTISPECIES: YfmQ family protein [unclassified Cytobacillus]|uniref:YfmQ family protein n=1 Tax=unclassified Cytobacillus TaxID=2675268 RepID=UPI00203F92DC|nr:YfmQ family protein [Cytobacillus sp. AMY 15.2]MCM3091018.1 YfmQ family protein [Cytobacillus sp. AMY 15.2]